MAQINKPNQYFNTVTYTGNGTARNITTGLTTTDWVWIKRRDGTANHRLTDVVRGATNMLSSNNGNATQTDAQTVTALGTNTFSLGTDSGGYDVNTNSQTYASWNWSAGGTAPSKTYTVKVVSDGGNKYRFDDFGTSAVTLEISEGGTYTFDQADASNSGHPIRFSTTSDGSHGGGSEYTTGVTTNGTPGNAGAYTRITVAASAPTLYYYCTAHSGMGGQANTPTTNSFSNFAGTIQSNISPNTTAGFSIVSWSGTGSNGTIGHGLGDTPSLMIIKNRNNVGEWRVWNSTFNADQYLYLNRTDAVATQSTLFNSTLPTSSVISAGTSGDINSSGRTYIAYCFAEKKGYSKFGSYTGNGNADGTFVYTGFKPAFVMWKRTEDAGYDWDMYDTARDTHNVAFKELIANSTGAESSATVLSLDILSNGFKLRTSNGNGNDSGKPYIYIAFAENPLVGTNNIPTTAR